jgi:hypothetical protein
MGENKSRKGARRVNIAGSWKRGKYAIFSGIPVGHISRSKYRHLQDYR